MSYLERLEIIGDIGSCEIKTSGSGNKYMKVSVAANRKIKTGEFVPQWYQGYIAGKMADNANLEALTQHFRPGRLVRIVGNPTWNSKNDKVSVDIMLTEMPMLLDKQISKR